MAEQVRYRDLERVFRKLDMAVDRHRFHVRARLELDGRVVVMVTVSHGRKEIPGRVAHQLRRSFKLTSEEFRSLWSCSMSKEEYMTILRSRLEDDRGELSPR